MEFVRKALEYRFWILVGIALLLPTVGWAMVIGSLKGETKGREAKLKGLTKKIDDLGRGTHANNSWKKAVEGLNEDLQKRVNAAWEELYTRQEPELTWPADVIDAMKTLGPDHSQVRSIYRDRYFDEVTKTARLAEPASMSFNLLKLEDWGDQPPTAEQMREAQEDIWVQRALLKVVSETNKPAETIELAPIKTIDSLTISDDAPAPPSVSIKGGMASGRSTTRSRSELPGRYQLESTAQYNLMRFHLAVTMDHRRMPELLAKFGSSSIPISVDQVSMINETGALLAGAGAARIGTDPTLAKVEFYGSVYLFHAPPSRNQQASPRGGNGDR